MYSGQEDLLKGDIKCYGYITFYAYVMSLFHYEKEEKNTSGYNAAAV